MITDGDLVLAESGAVMDDILAAYGNGQLRPGTGDSEVPAYLY